MKKWMIYLVVAIMAMVIAGCGSQANNEPATEPAGTGAAQAESEQPAENEAAADAPSEIIVTHALGETTVPVNPEKVVVFDFGVLDSLDQLGVEVTGVPQSNIPPYLAKYEDAAYENVGSLKEPDFEKISAIDPDLIIISGRQSDAYEELNKLGPTIFLGVDASDYMGSFESNARTLGEIFDKSAEVEEELTRVEGAIDQLHEQVTASSANALIVLANEGSISAYGAGSRFGIIHDVFGFVPVDDQIEVSTHGMSVSFEYIVEKNPDYLFVIDRGAAVGGESAAKAVIENDLVKRTAAYENGNIIYLDPNYWYLSGGGLLSVSEMVSEVAAALQP